MQEIMPLTKRMVNGFFFLDDDDIFAPRYLTTLAKEIMRFQNVGLFWSDVEIETINKGQTHTVSRVWPRYYVNASHLFSNALSIGASYGVAIRKVLFFEYGMFDVSYPVCEDVELIARFLSKEVAVKSISCIGVIKHESHVNRLSADTKIYSENYYFERIIKSYASFFSRYPLCKMYLLRHVLEVHRESRNWKGLFGVLKELWKLADRWHCVKMFFATLIPRPYFISKFLHLKK